MSKRRSRPLEGLRMQARWRGGSEGVADLANMGESSSTLTVPFRC